MPHRSPWGLAYGVAVGGCVVTLGAARYGLSGPLLLVGIVVAVAFGALAFAEGYVIRRRTLD